MAVRATAPSAPRSEPSVAIARPVRTCIGCRQKSTAAELLRVVAGPVPAGMPADAVVPVVPDPGKCAAGRGASVHPDPVCVEQAHRRRAFARALRVRAADPEAVLAYVARSHAPPQHQ